jgi:hypothetical protein
VFRLLAAYASGKIIDSVIHDAHGAAENFPTPSLITILQCLLPIDAQIRRINASPHMRFDCVAAAEPIACVKVQSEDSFGVSTVRE